jgi:hypothetical protein
VEAGAAETCVEEVALDDEGRVGSDDVTEYLSSAPRRPCTCSQYCSRQSSSDDLSDIERRSGVVRACVRAWCVRACVRAGD